MTWETKFVPSVCYPKTKNCGYLKPWRQWGFFFPSPHLTPKECCGKWQGTFNTSVLTHVYERALSSLKGAKLISALALLQAEKCTSDVCCFHYFPSSWVKTALNELKCVNHAFWAGCITNCKLHAMQSFNFRAVFMRKLREIPEGVWEPRMSSSGKFISELPPHGTSTFSSKCILLCKLISF